MPAAKTDQCSKHRVWRNYTGSLAWPTVLVSSASLALWLSAIVLHILDVLPTFAALVISFLGCYMALTPAHEAAHGNISGKSNHWLDRGIGWVSMFMLLGPFPPFKELHLRHHAHTNHPEKDPDVWMAVSGPSVFFRCLVILPRYYYCYFFPPEGLTTAVKQTRMIVFCFCVFYASLSAALISYGHFVTLVCVMIIPAWLALSSLAILFDWLPHQPHIEGRFLDTRVIPGPILNFLLLGQNFHLVHHLWPAVPWWHYEKLFYETEDLLREKGAHIHPNSDVEH